jgi:hypothetical protein
MKESRKEFIKQGHKSACSEWKEKIEKEFPELFKKNALVRGWSRIKGDEFALAFIQGIEETYGFDYKGRWSRNWCENISSTKYTPATDKEVEEALIKEAKKRGFKKGVSFLSISDGVKKQGSNFGYYGNNNQICLGGGTIFKDGEWAEVLQTITKQQAEKELGKTILN